MFRCKAGSDTGKEEKLIIYHMEEHYIFYFTRMVSVFSSSYRNTLMKVWENSKKLWKCLQLMLPQHFSFLFRMVDHYEVSLEVSPKHSCEIQNSKLTGTLSLELKLLLCTLI